MQHVFRGTTADEVWRAAAGALCSDGACDIHYGRGGRTYELLHVGLSLENPRQRWVVSRTPPLNVAFALAEVLWILSGRRDSAFLRYWNSKLPNFVGHGSELHGAYGHRLRHQFGIDQLERARSALAILPSSRQVVLQIWDPTADFPATDGTPMAEDIPCNVMSLLKVRRDRLEWMQIVRSNDIFLGTPYNLVQFTFLQEIIAGWLGVEPGTYSQVSDSLHAYDRDVDCIRGGVVVEPAISTDRYGLPKAQSEAVVAELMRLIERLIADDLTAAELVAQVESAQVPSAYVNIGRILGAEAARRRRWFNEAIAMGTACTNPALAQLWQRWWSARKKD